MQWLALGEDSRCGGSLDGEEVSGMTGGGRRRGSMLHAFTACRVMERRRYA